jgi:translation initiation factor IF-1
MPKNTENVSKSKGRKAVKEERIRKIALTDQDATYGRVLKAMGQRQFRVILPDASKRLIEVRATIPKKRALINVDDIVIITPSGSEYEIHASMDRKAAAQLSKEKKLHPDLLVVGEWDPNKGAMAPTNDVGIEFDYEGLPATQEKEKEEWNDGDVNKKADVDLNVDDI